MTKAEEVLHCFGAYTSAWLIESRGVHGQPIYWTGDKDSWTTDAYEACWFMRGRDASHAGIAALGPPGEWHPVEHGFPDYQL